MNRSQETDLWLDIILEYAGIGYQDLYSKVGAEGIGYQSWFGHVRTQVSKHCQIEIGQIGRYVSITVILLP